jgi:hypothetical protein
MPSTRVRGASSRQRLELGPVVIAFAADRNAIEHTLIKFGEPFPVPRNQIRVRISNGNLQVII